MRLALLLLLPGLASAQTLLSLSGTPVRPNTQATLNLTLSGSSGANLAGLQWTVTLPTGITPTVTAGTASTSAGKQVTCNQQGTNLTCLAVGLNTNVFGDGIVALVQFTPQSAGNLTFGISGTLGATLLGEAATVGAAAPFGFTVLSPCDLNGDTLTDVTDVQSAISQALGLSTCTSDLTGDGKCTVVEVVRVENAALGQSCKTSPTVIASFQAPSQIKAGQTATLTVIMSQSETPKPVRVYLPDGFSGPTNVTLTPGATSVTFPVTRESMVGALTPAVVPIAYTVWPQEFPDQAQPYAALVVPCCAQVAHCHLSTEEVSPLPCGVR